MVNHEKLEFLKHTFPRLLKKLDGSEVPEWGKMSPQQMIEHMTDSFRIADEKHKQTIHTPVEQLDQYKKFLMSDKEFRPLTKNPLLGETADDPVNAGITEAIRELEEEISFFIAYFENDPGRITTNGIFGHLNFEEWVQMLHKHAVHHLKQFRLL
jgi:hypothetical protein